MSLNGRLVVRLALAASWWSGVMAVLLCAAAARAQLTWVRSGTPPPTQYVINSPIPFPPQPYLPTYAFWDESRGRARCAFVSMQTSGGPGSGFTTAEFDGETWIGVADEPGATRYAGAVCADPRGAGSHVFFGGLQQLFPFYNDTYVWSSVDRAWSLRTPSTRPSIRAFHSMALLPGVGAVMFGGQTLSPYGPQDETWIWDGNDWRQVQTSPRPSPRGTSPMAFDPVRGELLLFGGYGHTDTWSFNGTRWLQLQPANSPPAWARQAVTDPVRGNVVLFGGTQEYRLAARNDTWTWDGTNWNQRTPAHAPPPRSGAVMTWDPLSQRVLMMSGYTGGDSSLTDSWAWDGYDWTQLLPTNRATIVAPGARSFATMVHRPQRGTVLFGGQVPQSILEVPLTDTWEGADGTWQRRTPSASPPQSFGNAGALLRSTGDLCWIPGQDRFGGALNQQWYWNGSNWSATALNAPALAPVHQVMGSLLSSQLGWVLVRLATTQTGPFVSSTLQIVVPNTGVVQPMFPPGGPSARIGSSMVQAGSASVASNRVWLFGGGFGGYLADVWELRDTGSGGNLAWTQLVPAAASPVPAGRANAAVAYDELRHRLVVTGGDSWTLLNDTWTFDLNTRVWTQVTGPGPSPRSGAAAAYDPAIDRVVLVGGQDGATRFDDVWEFDGTAWALRANTGRPQPRNNHSLAHDRAGRRSLVFGGHDGVRSRNDLWSYDGAAWTPLVGMAPSGLPPRRFAHSGCFVEQGASMVVFGGTTDGISELGDTWRLDQAGQWTPGALGPPARVNPAMVYAIVQGQPCCLLFGGYASGSRLGDTWRYLPGSNTWQQLAGGPPARDVHAMAWDRMRNVVVLFGGHATNAFFADDTWEFSCAMATWSQRTPANRPPARWNASMAFDESRGRTVMVGGYSGSLLNDVWEWDGTDWLQRTPETGPPSVHEDAGLVYDPRRGSLLLFGGHNGSVRLGDPWELRARIDTSGKGNTQNPLALRFWSQPARGQQLKLGFASPQGVGFYTLGWGPVQQPIATLPVPPLCEAGSLYANVASYLVLGPAEPQVAWNVPNSPLINGVTLVFQAFVLQAANCWRATDALHVRF